MHRTHALTAVSLLLLASLVGCSGEEGEPGLDGTPGADGATGTKGDQGEPGPKGDKGDQGDDGEPGAKGDQGDKGDRGEKGDKGDEGEPGAKGDKGDQGDDGAPAVDVYGVLAHEVAVGGAEMLDVSADGRYALVAGLEQATLLEIGRARLTVVQTLTLPAENLPEGSNVGDFTGMSIHPNGEYALIAVRDVEHAPASLEEVRGKVLAVSLPDLEVIGEITVGIGPDSVDIAPNGQFAVVANEDEEDETNLTNPDHRAGTVSIIDLRGGPAAMTQVEVPLPPEGIPYFSHDPQPETVKVAPDSSFVLATLQENNAIARITVPSPLPSPLTAGAFTVTSYDAGVRTGFGLVSGSVGSESCRPSAYDISLREEFTSAREPDGIAITPDGRFFVTADEDNLTWLNQQSHDGALLSPNGTRSISVYDAATGAFLGDSGDSIEQGVIASQLPQRCGSKGPEPEVVDVAVVRGRTLAFVALERSDAMSIHDITDPTNIRLLDIVPLNPAIVAADSSADYEPEGIVYVPGRDLVVVSNPAAGSVSLVELRFDLASAGGDFVPGSGGLPPLDCNSPVPGESDVVVNEIKSNPNPDFVELFNTGPGAVDLSGWKIIDNGAIGDAFVLPAGTTIAAGGYLVIEGDGSPVSTPLKLTFGIGNGDSVVLYTPCDVQVDRYDFGSHVSTASRCPDGTGAFVVETDGSNETKGAANACAP